ncbi:hypothetical protein [Fonticella tunisiensis]|uniref:Uncharacterized protein n=1 Tax=Fonticella tunisiensis TaxID=1096341 RepID=A0A4V3ETC5_9CLOT|nr:hypothetical protein [Fonticella tunisiensis]TDT61037.1 hypothetical protein EDD71_10941 [Fonticella tunisiensis]
MSVSCDCDQNFVPICDNANPEPLEIYAKRIIAKWGPEGSEEILFLVNTNGTEEKVPLRLCIHDQDEKKLQCFNMKKLINIDTEQLIICKHKVRLMIRFKLFMVAQFGDDTFDVIVLPQDVPAKACLLDLDDNPTDKSVLFPISFGDNEKLEIVTVGGQEFFQWTKDVPLDDPNWVGVIPCKVFDDPTLQSVIVIKSTDIDTDVLGTCNCGDLANPISGTKALISVFADIIDKIGIHQDICITGTVLDC